MIAVMNQIKNRKDNILFSHHFLLKLKWISNQMIQSLYQYPILTHLMTMLVWMLHWQRIKRKETDKLQEEIFQQHPSI